MSRKSDIVIALQGGGAHGAFAWGILEKILQDGRFNIKGLSGTSAGGMNAACVIQGLLDGSHQKSIDMLNEYWETISKMAASVRFETFDKKEDINFLEDKNKIFHLENNIFQMFSASITDHFSPYQFNMLNMNPLKDFIESFFNFDLFKQSNKHKIFLAATHVKSGKIKIFSNKHMSSDVLMASACLPHYFQTVSVDGEDYWDGGFIANPAIYPLMDNHIEDILVVQLTKTYCDELPTTKESITNRLKEITFNGCLVREMRAIHFISKLIDDGIIKENTLQRYTLHLLKNENAFKNITFKSAAYPKWEFITALKEKGRQTAQQWIDHYTSHSRDERHQFCLQSFNDFVS